MPMSPEHYERYTSYRTRGGSLVDLGRLEEDIAEAIDGARNGMVAADQIGGTIEELRNLLVELAQERKAIVHDLVHRLGVKQSHVARSLGLTPQRVHQLLEEA